VTDVDFKAANDYCLKLGLQLLTSAQHECASRGPALKILKKPGVTVERFVEGTDGLENFVTKLEMGAKIYTATDPALHNHLDQGNPAYAWRKYPTRSGQPDETWTQRGRRIAPVDEGPKNAYGLKGLGNVWEWCQDYFKNIKPWPLWV
jgi:formylglycine-generating enzyme required for sulfatase activity